MNLKKRTDIDAFEAGERNMDLAGGVKQEGAGGKKAFEHFKNNQEDIRKIMGNVLNESQVEEFLTYADSLDSGSSDADLSDEVKEAMDNLSATDKDTLQELLAPEDYYDPEDNSW